MIIIENECGKIVFINFYDYYLYLNGDLFVFIYLLSLFTPRVARGRRFGILSQISEAFENH